MDKKREALVVLLLISAMFIVFALTVQTATPSAASPAEQQAAQGYRDPSARTTIRGQVQPMLPGIAIQARHLDGELAAVTRPAADGLFEFPPLAQGTYRLSVVDAGKNEIELASGPYLVSASIETLREEHLLVLAGYEKAAPSAPVDLPQAVQPLDAPVSIPVQPVNPAPQVVSAPQASGVITGVVIDAVTASPVPYFAVSAFNINTPDTAITDYTDDHGFYQITVDPGTYQVRFKNYSGIYAPEWFDNHYSRADADLVTVASEQTVGEINAALEIGGSITGTVTDAATHAPLENLNVYLYDSKTGQQWEYVSVAWTDAQGRYEFNMLAPGVYYVSFYPTYGSGYLQEYYNNRFALADADPLQVSLNTTIQNIDASLDSAAVISGTIRAAGSLAPLEDVQVQIYTSITSTQADNWVWTGADGSYSFGNLLPGNYYLCFSPYSIDYIDECYQDQPDLAQADPLAVEFGDQKVVDVSLNKAGIITGTVTASLNHLPVEDVQVEIYTSTTSTSPMDYDWTNPAGIYTFTGLLPADYFICFRAPYDARMTDECYQNQPDLEHATPIGIGFGDRKQINVSLDKKAVISGTVTGVGGTPLRDIVVRLYDSPTAEVSIHTEWTGADGVFSFESLEPGTYYLYIDPPYDSPYYEEYYNDKTSLAEADALEATLNSTTDLDIVLAKGSIITGLVTGADTHQPLNDVDVYLYAWDECEHLEMIDFANTGPSGVYTFTKVVSGTYLIAYYPAWWGASAAYMAEFYDNQAEPAQATPIPVITSQDTTGINAELTRGGQISGQVSGLPGNTPLVDIYVDIYSSDGSYMGGVSTDTNGNYITGGLPAGTYSMQFSPSFYSANMGYLGEFYHDQVSMATATPINVVLGAMTPNVDESLTLGGQIKGTVTAEDGGAALESVAVLVFSGTDHDDWVGLAYTDKHGVYTTTGLTAGSYIIRFSPVEYEDVTKYYQREYYNNQAGPGTATPIHVALGNIQTGIDAVLVRGGMITGKVTDIDTGLPVWDLEVHIYDSQREYYKSTYTNDDGTYTVYGLPTGTYYVGFFPDGYYENCEWMVLDDVYYNQKSDLDSADPVTVTAPGTTTQINGQVRNGSAHPFKDHTVFLPMVKH